MAAVYSLDPVVVKLALALGLDPEKTMRFSMIVDPDNVVVVEATMTPDEQQIVELTRIIMESEDKPTIVEVLP